MASSPRKKRRPLRTLSLLLLTAAAFALFLHWENTTLKTTRFNPVFPDLPTGFDGCKIVVLSDLHGAVFGQDNQDLFAAVAAESPAYIFYLGDLEDRHRGPVPGYAESVAEGLSAIAPTYYVTGNHEWALRDVPALKKTLSDHGVTVLSNQAVTLERSGDTIVLALSLIHI